MTREGRGLYGLEGTAKDAPELVLSSLADLAELGLASMADVLPVPVGPESQSLGAGQPAVMAGLLADAKPATAELIAGLAKTVRDVREHEHPTWEDLYCLNLLSYMGERMGPVLRRLLDAEARVAELETKLVEYERPVDEDPIAYALTDRADAVEDVTPQVRKLRALLAGQRAQVVEPADQLTRVFAPTQALREDAVAETGGA